MSASALLYEVRATKCFLSKLYTRHEAGKRTNQRIKTTIQLGNGWYKSQFRDKGLQPLLAAVYDAKP
jgi:hypothetical protein